MRRYLLYTVIRVKTCIRATNRPVKFRNFDFDTRKGPRKRESKTQITGPPRDNIAEVHEFAVDWLAMSREYRFPSIFCAAGKQERWRTTMS